MADIGLGAGARVISNEAIVADIDIPLGRSMQQLEPNSLVFSNETT
jgi:hypothetical protein